MLQLLNKAGLQYRFLTEWDKCIYSRVSSDDTWGIVNSNNFHMIGESGKALDCFESILQKEPENIDCLKVLNFLI